MKNKKYTFILLLEFILYEVSIRLNEQELHKNK